MFDKKLKFFLLWMECSSTLTFDEYLSFYYIQSLKTMKEIGIHYSHQNKYNIFDENKPCNFYSHFLFFWFSLFIQKTEFIIF